MDEFDVYAFNVEVWHEDGEWNYSIIQEFDDDTEVLAYGAEETLEAAQAEVGKAITNLTFDLRSFGE